MTEENIICTKCNEADACMVSTNLKTVRENVSQAVAKSGRNKEDVTLIAVSKTKPLEMLEVAYNEGARDFGENKVQELCDKYEKMPKDVRFHMIGHLQTNKVKYLIGKAYLIHGVDSLNLANEIQKQSKKANTITNILIEVNVADEQSKFGVSFEEAPKLIEQIAKLENVRIKGLMCIAPYVENPEDNRQYFVKLRELMIDTAKQNIDNVDMEILSMGMTGDYMVAIEEGATYVRVGTGIFGERNYTI